MKKNVVIVLLVLINHWLFSQVNSYVNDNDVNVRDRPSIVNSKVIDKLSKNQKVKIQMMTMVKDKIKEDQYYWYLIEYKTTGYGWIFGKYLNSGNIEKNIERYVTGRDIRNFYGKKIITNLFGDSINYEYSNELIKDNQLISSQKTTFWQMEDSGFTDLNTYKTKWGEIICWVNNDIKKWRLSGIKINESNISNILRLGMSIEEMKSIIGDDFEIKDNEVTFQVNIDYDLFAYVCKINEGAISEISFFICFD